jgi:alpha-L-fucosidase
MKKILYSLLALVCLQALAATVETPAERQARMKWWREGRFGMFIHYGPVTLTGQEISWSRANSNSNCPNNGPTPVEVYDNLYKRFNPTHFNAANWAGLAEAAGMKYVVLTAKHCDGFLLWASKVDAYNMTATPFKRDLCAELAKAVRQDRLRLGWYFSPMDWRDPDFRTERNAAFITRMQSELSELLNNYGRIDVMWFDWDGGGPLYDQAKTYALVKKAQPEIIINNRLDLGPGDNDTKMLSALADYYSPEQHIGAYDDLRPWETCMTLGTQWSWKPKDNIKTAAEVIAILARTAGGDGNLLLDVGPMPDGRIEPQQVQVLRQVGAWMKRNGQSIYGTRGGPFQPADYGASTRKGKMIYLHVLKWPESLLKLPDIRARIVSAKLLHGGKADVGQRGGEIEISVAPAERDASDTVVALKLDSDALKIPAVAVSSRPAQPSR